MKRPTLLLILATLPQLTSGLALGSVPEAKKAVGVIETVADCKSHSVSTLTQLMERHKKGREQGEPIRYLYSPKWGWLDLAHFSLGAYLYQHFGKAGLGAFSLYELTQPEASQYSYEDLPSNAMGAFFSTQAKKPLCGTLGEVLKDLGFVENPLQVAPNGGNLDTGLKNKTYRPVYTSKYGSLLNSRDQKLEKFIQSLESVF